MIAENTLQNIAKQLYESFESGYPITPLTETYASMTVGEAYAIQRLLLSRHFASGRKAIGRKIGATSKEVQRLVGVDQPDYGVLLDAFTFETGVILSRSERRMISPRVEAELGFVLKKDVKGPGVTSMQLLSCIDSIFPVFEIVDSRIRDWKIKIADTIADNSSSWGIVLGKQAIAPFGIDLSSVGMVLEQDGKIIRTGVGAAVLGHPLTSAVWLVNTLGAYDETLHAGDLLLTGSLATLAEASPGRFRARFSDGLGHIEFVLTE
jgi:2-oxopent-4-enoate/cis-2-oxohex-4-enoate hydratase